LGANVDVSNMIFHVNKENQWEEVEKGCKLEKAIV
jgi:hypothetical protein